MSGYNDSVADTRHPFHDEQVEVVQRSGLDGEAYVAGAGVWRVGDIGHGGVLQPARGVEDERSYGRNVGAIICSVGPAGMGVGVPAPTVCSWTR